MSKKSLICTNSNDIDKNQNSLLNLNSNGNETNQ
jgi:hypothetical protein